MPETCAAIVIAAKHGELIKVRDYSGITNTVGALRCKFEFRTNDWDNATMTAVFCKGNMATNPEIVDGAIGVLLDSVDECAVPSEVLTRDAKYFSVGVWGVTATGLRIVSKWLVFRIEDGCYVDATEPIEPTPTLFEQIMATLASKAHINHEHNDIYYTKTELDDIIDSVQPDSNKNLIEQVNANTKARHTHSNNQVLNKFSEDKSGNPLYNGKAIVSELEESDPTVPSWAKQPKKPSYTATEVGALPNTTKIPSVTSDLANNSGFITNAVNNLTNYYLKSETYTQEEINQMISSIPKFSLSVVSSLPTENISNTTIYLLKETEKENNLYTEYIYVNGTWECLGSQQVDLTGYVKSEDIKTEIESALAEAKASGEFKGDSFTYEDFTSEQLESLKGEDGTSATHEWSGTVLTITSANGTTSADLKGERGNSGVYVGTGTMPEDCNVKINPNGSIIRMPTKLSELDNDKKFITMQEISELLEGNIGSVAEIYIGATEPSDASIVLWIDTGSSSGSGDTGNDNTGGDNTGDEGEGGTTGGGDTGGGTGDMNGKLPSEYQEVEYVVTPKGAYSEINTGVLSDTITKIEMGLKTDFSNYVAIVSGAQTTGTGENTDFSKGANDKQSPCINNLGANTEVKGTSAFTSFTTTAIPSDYMSGEHYVDFTFEMICPISQYYCFGDSVIAGWNTDNREIYYFKMYDTNNVLVADFVPCYRKSDNKVGMYDLARQAFYAPSHGVWTKGADV